MDIKSQAHEFSGNDAYKKLLDFVEEYFQTAGHQAQDSKKVIQTELPPLYLQRRGHSMTIVGLEYHTGHAHKRSLIVFDPGYTPRAALFEERTAQSTRNIFGSIVKSRKRTIAMGKYRRGPAYLRKYNRFEVLQRV